MSIIPVYSQSVMSVALTTFGSNRVPSQSSATARPVTAEKRPKVTSGGTPLNKEFGGTILKYWLNKVKAPDPPVKPIGLLSSRPNQIVTEDSCSKPVNQLSL